MVIDKKFCLCLVKVQWKKWYVFSCRRKWVCKSPSFNDWKEK